MVTVPKSHEVPNVERPWVYRLPFTQVVLFREREDPARHFTLKEVKSLTREEFWRLVRERLAASRNFKDHALVFVHGFNTTFDFSALPHRADRLRPEVRRRAVPLQLAVERPARIAGLQLRSREHGPSRAAPARRSWKSSARRPAPNRSASSRTAWATSCCCPCCATSSARRRRASRSRRSSWPPPTSIATRSSSSPRRSAGVSRGITMLAAVQRPRARRLASVLGRRAARRRRAVARSDRGARHRHHRRDGGVDGPVRAQPLRLCGEASADRRHPAAVADRRAPADKRVPILESVKTERGEYWRYPGVR